MTSEQYFPAAFMLRNESFLSSTEDERKHRSVYITSAFIQLTSPIYLSIIELRDDKEREFVERIYGAVPTLSKKISGPGGWSVEFHRELNMTDDAWRFRRREWLMERGCRQQGCLFLSQTSEWFHSQPDDFVPGVRYIVPEGTKYRITSVKPLDDKIGTRGQRMRSIAGFLLKSRADDESEMPIVPDAQYVPLYEGRMVHQFDHAAKAYVTGEGRGAIWRDLDLNSKAIIPHFYTILDYGPLPLRAGFCRVTGQTNERTLLASAVPIGLPAGDTVSIAEIEPSIDAAKLVWVCLANSFLIDFFLRQKISTTMNFFFLATVPFVQPQQDSPEYRQLAALATQLVSITPEIKLAEPAQDPVRRAGIRAEVDTIVAKLYNLSTIEFAYILTTFPLLDRDQPPLPDDLFVRWNKQGKPKFEPRSYVTRDTALLAYFRHRGIAPPEDLAIWYRDEVKVNMIDDEFCPFRMGPIRSLEQRVAEYSRLGAIAYIPSKAKKWDPNGPYQPRTQEVIA